MKICTKCKTEKPLDQFYVDSRYTGGYTTRCRECKRKQGHQDYLDNQENKLAYYREYRAKNKDEVNRRKREARNANRLATNEESRKYREANKDKERERQRRWGRENPEKVLEANFRRRVRKANATKFLVTDVDLKKIRSQKCAYCGTSENITIDHVVPLAKGGSHSIGNLAPACGICNSSKGAKFVTEWRLTKQLGTDSQS